MIFLFAMLKGLYLFQGLRARIARAACTAAAARTAAATAAAQEHLHVAVVPQ